MISSVIEASRLRIALCPPGDISLVNGAPDRWTVSNDPRVVIARQKHLDHLRVVLRCSRLNYGEPRVAELAALVKGLRDAVARIALGLSTGQVIALAVRGSRLRMTWTLMSKGLCLE